MKRMVLGLAFSCVIGVATARDLGQWEASRSRDPGMVPGADAAG